MQSNLSPLAFAASACVGANRAKVFAYSAVIAFVLRDGKANEKGFTQTLRRNLAREIAIARVGGVDAWESLPEETRDAMKDRADATAKRYAEKSIRVAAIAAEKGLELAGVLEAQAMGKGAKAKSAEQVASEHVFAWLNTNGVDDQESLTAFAGMATAGGPKGGTPKATPQGDGGGDGESAGPEAADLPQSAPANEIVGHFLAATRACKDDMEAFAREFTAFLGLLHETARADLAQRLAPVLAEAAGYEVREETVPVAQAA
ncbi:hypothetical protein [Cupriavidus sp. RAF12]|uniref:hypothetical protein n=1 Tax=Cupriavidus sp. RAF12 TaxID=3233050 RepID=UPI003F9224AF